MAKKSWLEKLKESEAKAHAQGLPRVEEITDKMSKRWGTGTLVIPTPMEVDKLMMKVPYGKLTTINAIREVLAQKHNATIACPITTGIFASIAAKAAEERRQQGETDFTPYWRTLKVGGEINEKYPGGVEAQTQLLEKEGHQILRKGKKSIVANYEQCLAKILA